MVLKTQDRFPDQRRGLLHVSGRPDRGLRIRVALRCQVLSWGLSSGTGVRLGRRVHLLSHQIERQRGTTSGMWGAGISWICVLAEALSTKPRLPAQLGAEASPM